MNLAFLLVLTFPYFVGNHLMYVKKFTLFFLRKQNKNNQIKSKKNSFSLQCIQFLFFKKTKKLWTFTEIHYLVQLKNKIKYLLENLFLEDFDSSLPQGCLTYFISKESSNQL